MSYTYEHHEDASVGGVVDALSSDLDSLEAIAMSCTRCTLAQSRTTVVFGDGKSDADLMLIGEAPGYHEDQQGIPFVGAAGNLLTTLLEEVGIDRSLVYIANVLKCRPPGNRDPSDEEVDACKEFLFKQLELVAPLVIVTLGNFATRTILARSVGISRLRGQVFPYKGGAVVIPTYHPAALLRGTSPARLAEAKSDMRLVAETLDKKRRDRDRTTGGSISFEGRSKNEIHGRKETVSQLELF